MEWILVPRNPTEEMVKAGESWSGLPSATWQDMLDAAPIPTDVSAGTWHYPKWVEEGNDIWALRQDGVLVGEAYQRDEGTIKWHCKTSDWRDINAKTIEQAKAECEASFWKEEWEQLRAIVNGKAAKV